MLVKDGDRMLIPRRGVMKRGFGRPAPTTTRVDVGGKNASTLLLDTERAADDGARPKTRVFAATTSENGDVLVVITKIDDDGDEGWTTMTMMMIPAHPLVRGEGQTNDKKGIKRKRKRIAVGSCVRKATVIAREACEEMMVLVTIVEKERQQKKHNDNCWSSSINNNKRRSKVKSAANEWYQCHGNSTKLSNRKFVTCTMQLRDGCAFSEARVKSSSPS
jgi:hypothetical protein